MRICYCEDCGARISEQDIASGQAVQLGAESLRCAKCAAASSRPKDPGKTSAGTLRAVSGPPSPGLGAQQGQTGASATRSAPAAPSATASRGATTGPHSRVATAARGTPSTAHAPAVPEARGRAVPGKAAAPKHSVWLIAAGGVLGLAGLLLVILAPSHKPTQRPAATWGDLPSRPSDSANRPTATAAQAGDSANRPTTPVSPPADKIPESKGGLFSTLRTGDPAPADKTQPEESSPREGAATRRLEAIKSYWKEHPDDPWEYHEMLSDFLNNSRGTNAGKEGARLLTELKLPAQERPAILLAHWKFDESTGTTAQDSAGASHATLKGQASHVAGKIGAGAVGFGGNPDDYVDLGAAPGLNFAAGAPFTIAGWVKTSAAYGAIVSFRHETDDSAVIDIMVGFDGAGNSSGCLMALVRQDGGRDFHAQVTGGQVNNGAWRHFALTRNREGVIRLFLDGALQGSNSNTESGGAITTNLRCCGVERLWVAKNTNSAEQRALSGSIDDLRIYGRALTASEIGKLGRSE